MFAEKSKKMMPELPQRTRQESTHSDIRHLASQIGNQAMLELLRSDKPVAAGVPSLIDEMRERYGWNQGNISTSAGVPLPSDLKKEYEESSGVSLDDVKVHYNSDQPERFGAEAFAYGENIFLKPERESLITHELGHVVQQKQGLVNATHNENSYPVNDKETLEQQADKPVIHVGKSSRVKVRKVAKPVMQFYIPTSGTSYRKGTHGYKGREKERLLYIFGDKPTWRREGKCEFESEHTIGFKVLNDSGVVRGGTSEIRRFENDLPAYQEIYRMHRNHIGTGNRGNKKTKRQTDVRTHFNKTSVPKADGRVTKKTIKNLNQIKSKASRILESEMLKHSDKFENIELLGFESANDYRNSQRAAIEGRDVDYCGGKKYDIGVSNAIQLNQLG